MARHKNSQGFSAIEALLILVIVSILGFAGWFVYHSQKAVNRSYNSANTTNQSSSGKTASTVKLDKTYVDQTGNFTIKYPSTWKVQTSTANQGGADYPTTSTTLTSPSGTVLNLSSDWGGFGGVCEPVATDVPFKAGNTCPSREYLTSEMLPIHNVYYSSGSSDPAHGINFTYTPSTIVLTTIHYSDPQGVSKYIIGITSSNPSNPVEVNKPTMGLNRPETFFEVQNSSGKSFPLIYAYASGSDTTFLKTNDASIVKNILRTLTVTLPK